MAKAVNAALAANIETKKTIYSGASTVSYGGTIISLTANLVRGDASINECTGILIKPKRLRLSVLFSMTVAGSYNMCRALVFRWHDASTPVPSGILSSVSSPLAPQSSIYWINNRKIQVLADKVVVLYDHGGAVDAHNFLIDIDPGKAPIQLPASGSGATPQMDGLYLLLITDDAGGVFPACDVHSALYFTDA